MDIEVVALDAPDRLEFEARSQDVRSRCTFDVRARDGGSEVTATTTARVDDADDGRAVEPAANPTFTDLGASLLAGLEAAFTDEPTEPR